MPRAVSLLAKGITGRSSGQGSLLPSNVFRLTDFRFFIYRPHAAYRRRATSPPVPLSQGERGRTAGVSPSRDFACGCCVTRSVFSRRQFPPSPREGGKGVGLGGGERGRKPGEGIDYHSPLGGESARQGRQPEGAPVGGVSATIHINSVF